LITITDELGNVLATTNERVDHMNIHATINPDASVSVVETINYDFAETNKHGIYRTIPLGFTAKGQFDHTTIQIEDVVDELGNSYTYSVTSKDPFNVRIGDADEYVTGKHVYKISYTIKRSIGYFDNYDEWYWNLTGDAWEVPIHSVTATIVLPDSVDQVQIKTSDYCGTKGATGKCGSFTIKGNTINYQMDSDYYIESGSQVTIGVGFPKGLVLVPTKMDLFLAKFQKIWYIPIPFIIAFLWFRKKLKYLWKRHKYFRKNPLITQYDAREFSPLEAGILINKKLSNKDVSASIVLLAINRFIKIENRDGEFCFTRTQKVVGEITKSEESILDAIVGKCESEFSLDEQSKFYSAISFANSRLIARDYLESKNTTGGVSMLAGQNVKHTMSFILPLFFAVNPGIFIWFLAGVWAGFIFSGSMVLVAIIGPLLKKTSIFFTEKGFEAELYLRGLKKYIEVAEKDRIEFANAPTKTPELFEKLLPYAMVFGLEEKWAKEFEGLYTKNPEWYSGGSTGAFSTIAFVGGMASIQSSVQSSLQSAIVSSIGSSPRSSWSSSSGGSSGGGSSGGGGGGGGGGSW
jgi:uncharacterized membrane protein YgcG